MEQPNSIPPVRVLYDYNIHSVLRVAWDVGFCLGGNYGSSIWYGEDDDKWFK